MEVTVNHPSWARSLADKAAIYLQPTLNDISRVVVLSGVAAFSSINPFVIVPYVLVAHAADIIGLSLIPYIVNNNPRNTNIIREYTLIGLLSTAIIATGVELTRYSPLTGFVPLIEVVATVASQILYRAFY